jgi:hypothetical protein
MNDETARVMGGIFVALCSALSPEGAEMANDVLFGFANSPNVRPEDQRIYRAIVDCATRPIDDLGEENEQPQRRFEVIQGGNNAA